MKISPNTASHAAPRAPRRGGFTLLEVIFAMAILAIGLLAVAALLPVAAIQQKRALDDQLGTAFGLSALSVVKTGGRTQFSSLYPATADAPCSDYTPYKAYTTSDPSGVFDYRTCYSMSAIGAPINVAVFVYRKVPNASPKVVQNTTITQRVEIVDDATNKRTIIAGTGAGQNSAPTTTDAPASTYADIYRRNSMLLIVNTNVTPYKYYTARVTSASEKVGAPAYITPMIGDFIAPTGCVVYCLTDNTLSGVDNTIPTKAVPIAIVQGIIP